MADPHHLAKLAGGIAAWNLWHEELGQSTTPFSTWPDEASYSAIDLTGADLRHADLRNANLCRVNLRGANLEEADMRGADLARAQLRSANLTRAALTGADLTEADARGANLRGALFARATLRRALLLGADLRECRFNFANLRKADLSSADLRGAYLIGSNLNAAIVSDADFYGAKVDGTIWGALNLSGAKNLDRIHHGGPSTVGIDTILMSGGNIPEVFLRGCGVPDNIIDQQQAFVQALSPIQFYSCFISYSHKDEAFTERLHGRLQQEGLRVWYAPEEMKAGRKLHEQIDEAIRMHDKLLLVVSEASMASEWVATEMAKARRRERREGKRVLFPIGLVDFRRIEQWECFDADTGKDSAREIREYYIPDFSNWKYRDTFETEFAKLLAALRASV